MNKKQKLELTWIGKDKRPRLEPRILLEEPEFSYQAGEEGTHEEGETADLFAEQAEDKPRPFDDNILIQGDNLLALKSLEQQYAGKVKCIYIDPPFNTGEAFDNYDDGLEHSIWLSLIYQRIELLIKLLAEDGSMFVHIDDNEIAYLMVVLDELLGRKNRVNIITFKQGSATGHKSINPGLVTTTNYILVYAKNKELWKPKRLFTARERDSRYSQYIRNFDEPYASWELEPLNAAFARYVGLPQKQIKKQLGDSYEEKISDFVLNNANRVVQPARPDYNSVGQNVRDAIDHSRASPSEVVYLERENHENMYFKNGQRWLFYTNKLKFIDGGFVAGEPLTNLWSDILSNNLHKEGGVKFPKGKKPEALIKRILELSTNSGDLVLDSFGGSGTTAAVAHKMCRRWIAIELGKQCETHIVPRLKQVVDGVDQDGISKAVKWNGGGGYKFYRLAASLLKKDVWDNWVINPEYNGEMLSEAMCKHMGYTYAPSQDTFWNHGYATENNYIYVTTGTLSHDQLKLISNEVGDSRSLLLCSKGFMAESDAFPNLNLKKIPQAVLHKCEWDHDDYSFDINVLPEDNDESHT